MRDLTTGEVAQCRDVLAGRAIYGSAGDGGCGVFRVPSPRDKRALLCIASTMGGWDHVSVSRRDRVASWDEMCHVVSLFFDGAEETVMQIHVPAGDHINCAPNCLHLWRPQETAIPRPPAWMVGAAPPT